MVQVSVLVTASFYRRAYNYRHSILLLFAYYKDQFFKCYKQDKKYSSFMFVINMFVWSDYYYSLILFNGQLLSSLLVVAAAVVRIVRQSQTK